MKYYSLVSELKNIIKNAGEIIMQHYGKEHFTQIKQDSSPVTIGDKKSDEFLKEALFKLDKKIPYISEENENSKIQDLYWLVDPLDGTKSFIKNGNNFVVNIALIENGVPILGLIYSPIKKQLFYSDGANAYREFKGKIVTLKVQNIDLNNFIVTSSSFHKGGEEETLLKKFEGRIKQNISISSAYKFCMLAEGSAHLYPRLFPTSYWDIASGNAIVKAVGLQMVDLNANDIKYTNQNFLSPYFIAGHKSLIDEIFKTK